MSDERPTVRPVTLARLVEATHLCRTSAQTTDDIEERLDMSHRRARETLLETVRIDLITETDDDTFVATTVGEAFVDAIRDENWIEVSSILETHSPHYGNFLEVVEESGPVQLETVLEGLEDQAEFTPYSYNQTSVEVVGDWGKRLGTVQRNAFTGEYYRPKNDDPPPNFHYTLLGVYDELEETAGVGLRQRYLSIPEVRERLCANLQLTRQAFDEALAALAKENVGKLELSGAPMDTGAKEARYGIKEMALAGDDMLVSTSQSTEKVMQGIEQYGKQYYYLTVHDRELTYTTQ
ncbi:hypothetical protein [Haloarcula marismortui]|uniref:Uncharacterized protein n=1 Tax=Haloarcula marismortui ATCC 33800 TaxID=662476 RepID=M0JLL1_9EURY|nr:hypothetical protein [Haloarcula sinaiiensis]EMA10007.1 hypothetical protein C436_18351 [Haloarcula sinaiiensis ATCC 33800]QUJ74965.1 hypothetical protein KDQ40_22870 [Haloarcula sinaiiensis ATCC 33800]